MRFWAVKTRRTPSWTDAAGFQVDTLNYLSFFMRSYTVATPLYLSFSLLSFYTLTTSYICTLNAKLSQTERLTWSESIVSSPVHTLGTECSKLEIFVFWRPESDGQDRKPTPPHSGRQLTPPWIADLLGIQKTWLIALKYFATFFQSFDYIRHNTGIVGVCMYMYQLSRWVYSNMTINANCR